MRKTRVILTEHERDLYKLIHHVKRELKINALINEELGAPLHETNRIFDLLTLKDLLLTSLMERSNG